MAKTRVGADAPPRPESAVPVPPPVDTSLVRLPEEVARLVEPLAANAHHAWVEQKLREGWRKGPREDGLRKEQPFLVPYDDLPPAEKARRRDLIVETLKAVYALGHEIQPRGEATSAEVDQDPDLAALLQRIDRGRKDLAALMAVWREREQPPARELWSRGPRPYRRLAECLRAAGAPGLAHEVVAEGLDPDPERARWPSDVRLRQLQALALADLRSPERARQVLDRLHAEGALDKETLGILGRIHKDLGALAAAPADREHHLLRALEHYDLASREFGGGYWTGINVATVAVLLGNRDLAREWAKRVFDQCRGALVVPTGDGPAEGARSADEEYWLAATLGEAALILDDEEEARHWYTRAAEIAGPQLGQLNSTRRNARLLLPALGKDAGLIDRWLPVPRVAIFAGHLLDRPTRPSPRFPPSIAPAVKEAIRAKVQEMGVRVGYASAACGSDILFLETVLELGGEAHVVIPYSEKEFVQDRVNLVPGPEWQQRCRDVLARATEVVEASPHKMKDWSVSAHYANNVLFGLAAVRAAELNSDLTGLAVWDGLPPDGPFATALIVDRWKRLGLEVEQIDLREILWRERQQRIEAHVPWRDPQQRHEPRLMAMLFADAVKFSTLTEEQLPNFVRHFLGAIARLAADSEHPSVVRNTWGDGLYFVFDSVREAGLFALDLCDLVTGTRWETKGLPEKLSIRIALHAGPVLECDDPITGQKGYTGTHISRAARIEPITPPGMVYASQAFAALAKVEKVTDFTCEYVKLAPLPKGYGTFPTYLVRRSVIV